MCNVNNAANVITSLVTVDSALPSSHCIWLKMHTAFTVDSHFSDGSASWI